MLNASQDTITQEKNVQYVLAFQDTQEIRWDIVPVVNVKVMLNVVNRGLASTTHVLIHALDNAEQMPSANQDDTLPFVDAHKDSPEMLWLTAANQEVIQ